MKVPLLLFIFYINYVICANDKYAVKRFPKKVKPYGTGKILIHSGKYVLKNKPQVTSQPKDNRRNSKYTVFQVVGNTKAKAGVPDSPYFPVEQAIDQKPRVKKVLPDYVWSSLGRYKRSADETKKDESQVTTSKTQTDAKPTTPKDKEKEITKTEKSEPKNENPELRANEKDKTKDVKKEESKLEKKEGLNQTESKNETLAKSTGRTPKKGVKPQRKGKNKGVGRNNKSKTRNGTRSKTRSRGKSAGRNGTALKKSKQSSKRQGRSKTKGKKNQPLRQPKGHLLPKGSKNGKSAKKQVERKGNSTDIKIPKETRRLTAAREALIEDYPYVVSIQKDGEHWCSGALLNPRLVITTANCLWKANRMSRMQVRAGSSFTDHGGQLVNIQEVMKHPRWGLRKNPDNDIALILLDKNIKFSHTVHGVDLPNRVMMPSFDDAWVASWGSERRDGIFDQHENALQVYHAYLMSNESCNNVTKRFGITVSASFICFSQAGKTAPCTRDTGAPAVSDGVLWGLASWGIRKLCGTERFPAMFSYTAAHSNIDFIANATRFLMADERFYPFLDRPPVARTLPPVSVSPTISRVSSSSYP